MGGVESPEEERDENDSAADAKQTGQKTRQAAEDDKQEYGCCSEGTHAHPEAEQASRDMADLLIVEAPSGFEPLMEILQTSALPLGDGAIEKECL